MLYYISIFQIYKQEMVDFLNGEIYKKDFKQKKELGRGKFGVVFQVEEKVTKNVYAAKHIKTRKREQKAKAVEEITMLQNLSNLHIMKLISAYENPGEVIMIMEYLAGGELFDKVADEDYVLTESDCSAFLKQICLGVEYLHSQYVVHLDIKVSTNLLGDPERCHNPSNDFSLI